jgi:putative heme iron utilization protein
MIAVDRHGFDLAIDTSEGVRTARIAFPEEVSSPDAVRKTLVAMVRDARSRLGGGS